MVDETKYLIEAELARILEEMSRTDNIAGDKDDHQYRDLMSRANDLADRLIEIDKNDVEREKMENNIAVENVKQSMPRWKIGLEVFKTAAPIIANGALWIWGMSKTLTFEETGRFTSQGSRTTFGSFPKIWFK